MDKKALGYIIIANILLAIFLPISPSAVDTEEEPFWDNEWSYRVEIFIPIDTSKKTAVYQPIDISIEFENPCWAKDEIEHSIRVIFQDGNNFIELESQIYNLSFQEEEFIDSCNIVFLIPEDANGNEKYFIYYDDESKACTDYEDHVDIGESYYHYEQIPGLVLESSYYEIIEEGDIIYAVNKRGRGLNEVASQQVQKLKDKTKNVVPKKSEIGISIGFVYYYKKDSKMSSFSSTEVLVDHERIIDGNLMLKFGIVSVSKNGLLKTTTIYKYYFCPNEDKKIYLNVKHEVTGALPKGTDVDVSFLIFAMNRIKSVSVDELNFGTIYPYMNYYSSEERIITTEIDQYPESSKWQKIIGFVDDQDLGSSAWLSVGEGEKGRTDAVIFDSNNVIKSGSNELDGISLQLHESNNIQFPGLTGQSANIYFGRNAFDGDDPVDEIIPDNYSVEFNLEFFTTKNGGYKSVIDESEIYQKLIKYQPKEDEDVQGDEKETEKYNLTATVHLAPSFPFGSLLSAGYGLNASYITAELYKENKYTSSGSVCRLSLCENVPADFFDFSLIVKLKALLDIFDWKNFSFFKKIKFTDVEPGIHLIKIYRENPLFSSQKREFIGYKIVNIESDKSVDIKCKNEGKVLFSFLDQNNDAIKDVKAALKIGNIVISEGISDSEGKILLTAPCGFRQEYDLNITYKGFLINEEKIKLSLIRKYISLKKSYNFEVYDLTIKLENSNEDLPDFEFALNSKEMIEDISIRPSSQSENKFLFSRIYPANYSLNIKYDNFRIIEDINIAETSTFSIMLHDFKSYIKDSLNLSPGSYFDVSLKSLDFDKNTVLSGDKITSGEYNFYNLYPGKYNLRVCYKSDSVNQNITIPKESATIVFPYVYNFTAIVLDSHADIIKDALFQVERDGEILTENTDDEGKVIFKLPPGSYNVKIYYENELISERKFDILNEKESNIVTEKEPFNPYFMIGLSILLLCLFGFISLKIKRPKMFLKVLAICLILITIMSPWWAIDSSKEKSFDSNTKLYLNPTKMIELTKTDNVTAGSQYELDSDLKKEVDILFTTIEVGFLGIMGIISNIVILSIIIIALSIILKQFSKNKLSVLFLFLSIILLIFSIATFTVAMSEFAGSTVGSFIGSGDLDVSIPGQDSYMTVLSSWGPDISFYLIIGSIFVISIVFIIEIKKPISSFFKRFAKK